MNVSIQGLNKASLLAALYNASSPRGLGVLQFNPTPMTQEEAQTIIDNHQGRFDYVKGRSMKIDLSTDEVDTWLFNRENGEGVAERIIESLRQSEGVAVGG